MYKVLFILPTSDNYFYFMLLDLVIRKADIELKSKEEEIRFLNIEV